METIKLNQSSLLSSPHAPSYCITSQPDYYLTAILSLVLVPREKDGGNTSKQRRRAGVDFMVLTFNQGGGTCIFGCLEATEALYLQ